jgi:ketosteroid isomerase-like protein
MSHPSADHAAAGSPVEPAAPLSETTARFVARLDAKETIRRLMYDYGYYVDLNDPDHIATLFTDDCSVTYAVGFGAEGIEEYRSLLDGIGSYFAATAHYVTNVSIDLIDDSHAHVRAMVYAWHKYVRERPDSEWLGYYFNEVIRAGDGSWKIRRLEMRSVNMVNHHLPPDTHLAIGRL